MDEYTRKRTTGRLGIAKRGPALSFKDSKEEVRRTRCDNRIGCNTRLKAMKGTQISNPKLEKDRCSRPCHSRSSNTIAGSSSKPLAGRGDLQKPHEQQYRASVKKAVLAESSSVEAEAEFSSSTTEGHPEDPQNEDAESLVRQNFSVNTEEEVGSSNRKQVCKQSGLRGQHSSFGSCSSVRHPSLSRSTRPVSKSLSTVQGSKACKDGPRNLSCASVSNFHRSCKTSPHSGRGRAINATKKGCAYEESSSSKTKATAGISTRENSISQRKNTPFRSSLSIHKGSSSWQTSGKTKTWSTARDCSVAVRTQSTSRVETRTRLPAHAKNNSSSRTEPVITQQLPRTEVLVSESTSAGSSELSPTEADNTLEAYYSDIHNDTDGIAEVLLALERVGQDAYLTYEQLLALETNSFSGAIGLHDQHRDLRMDIDNMSYEELLALEEIMGTVSTALTEEALLRCLKRGRYTPTSLLPGLAGCENDDVKCSICQEEYVDGDEVGKLSCEHRFHVECINQWLRMKNWCPFCKAAASPS